MLHERAEQEEYERYMWEYACWLEDRDVRIQRALWEAERHEADYRAMMDFIHFELDKVRQLD